MKSQKSHVVCQEVNETTLIIYHSLHNQPQQIEFENESDKLDFIFAVTDGLVETGVGSVDAITLLSDEGSRDIFSRKQDEYLGTTKSKVSYISLMVAENCNLGCSYCIAAMNMDEAKKNRSVIMSWEMAKASLDWYFSLPSDAEEYYVNFSGGEPLVNKQVVIQAVEYIRSKERDKAVTIIINTNATLVDDWLAEFFAINHVEIATSLDGTPDASDRVRITKKGLPASESIVKGWRKLKAFGCELSGFMATFNDKNIQYLAPDIVDFAISMGFSWVRISCDVIHLLNYSIDDAVEQIWSVYQYGREKGIKVEGYWGIPITNMLHKDRIPGGVSFFCGAVSGETVSVHPDGRISACGFSSGSFGNITLPNPFDWEKHQKFVEEYYPGSREFCKGCSIEGSCAGGCNISREVSVSTKDESAILYNCEMYRRLTKRLLISHFADESSEFSKTDSPYGYIY